jgi:glycosyltransferase involved in cell wall biosynthesis
VKELGVSDIVVELGTIPYSQLHQLYASAQVYVTPAYAETFAHPLVEAMANGVPVVASDIPVHREICKEAAAYFPIFSPEGLAEKLAQLIASPETMDRMATAGRARSEQFSWKTHVDKILGLCTALVGRTPREAGIAERSIDSAPSPPPPQQSQSGAAMIRNVNDPLRQE